MSTQTAVKLEQNQHVGELLSLLKTNGRQNEASELTGVMGHMALIERQLDTMAADLRTARRELATMRDERDHPVRTMYQRMEKALSTRITAARQWLSAAKENIIEGAKNAVSAVKQSGIVALDATMGSLGVRDDMIALRDTLARAARSAGKTIARIEAVSGEYHAVGSHIRNLGRTMAGKEQQQDIRPNGGLARLSQSLFANVQDVLNGIARDADKAVDLLDRLADRAKGHTKQEKNSVMEDLQTLKVAVADAPAPSARRQQDASL